MPNCQQRVFSAPGKAILAGGYLVLDPSYKAFVVALSSRMHALTQIKSNNSVSTSITINSPQFTEGSWSYQFSIKDFISHRTPLQEISKRKNPFVEATIFVVLNYVSSYGIFENKNIQITIFSDSEYHSHLNSVQQRSNNGSYIFSFHKRGITEVAKTGLGSSAGLVTSLTCALLSCYFDLFDVKNESWKMKVHNLSQIAHCKAQGKVGSGFDVASATFGSIVYKRFSPALIDCLWKVENSDGFPKSLRELVDDEDWKIVHQPSSMPKGIRLLMGDVMGGSETPKMVSKVLKWRKENPEKAHKIWTSLNESNMKLIKCLENLINLEKNSDEYEHTLEFLNNHSAKGILSDGTHKELLDVVKTIKEIRRYLKIMTIETAAEIEPDTQTQLLDDCENLAGVLGGVVPGAGGYDAICLLVSTKKIDEIVEKTKQDERFKNVRWMNLNEQDQGIMEENFEDFVGLSFDN